MYQLLTTLCVYYSRAATSTCISCLPLCVSTIQERLLVHVSAAYHSVCLLFKSGYYCMYQLLTTLCVYYSRAATITCISCLPLCVYYSRAATSTCISCLPLCVATIQERLLFKSGYYYQLLTTRVANIKGWLLFKGG